MVERALDIADRAYVMQNGAMIGSGTPDEIRTGDLIRRAYLGAVSDRAKP
jgi:ABC-type lipopolysaccharide export system ATPase subunit